MSIFKKQFILLVLLFTLISIYSQDKAAIDSLTKALRKIPDKQKAEVYNKIAKEYKYYNNEKCLENANKALELAREYKNDEYEAEALHTIGESNFEIRKYEIAKDYLNQSLEIARELKNKIILVDVLTTYGALYDETGYTEDAIKFLQEALQLAKDIDYKNGILKAINYIGFAYYYSNQFSQAIQYFEESYILAEESNDSSSMEINARVLGACYYRQGNYTKAVERYIESLKLSDKLGNTYVVAGNMNNIANVYKQQKYFDEAFEYYTQSKNIYRNINDSTKLAVSYNNLGNLLREKVEHIKDTLKKANKFTPEDSLDFIKDYLQAKKYMDSSIFIIEKLNDSSSLAGKYFNRATILKSLKRYNESLYEYQKALEMAEKLNDERLICQFLTGAGELYFIMKNYEKALSYFKRSQIYANKLQVTEYQRNNYEKLSWVYEQYGNYKQALINYKKYVEKNEILFNEESAKTIRQMKEIYESDKKQQQLEKFAALDEAQKATIKQQKTLNIAIGVGAVFILAFLVFAFMQLRVIKRKNVILNEKNIQISQQKEEIEAQRDEIQEQRDVVMKQKEEITDSIYYAQRIQKAVLPSDDLANNLLPEYFILFRPRDIVSGDFYWMTKKNNRVITVAADCTGHGVPGAFMSMLGVSFLNEIVNKLDKPEAHIILNYLRDYVKTTLDQTGKKDEAKDGMDISLTIYDFEKKIVEYAGAYNSMYIVRKGEEEVIEYKADKMPIGIYIKEKESFTKHTVQLQSGDNIYTFSDGFVDQFGGESGRKFMSKPFKRLLLEIQSKSMAEQREILYKAFDDWRGEYPQIDDVIILGIRIS